MSLVHHRGTPLDRLSQAYGLQLSYVDAAGKRQFASDEAKRAVLRAMSVEAGSPRAIARSVAEAPPPIPPEIEAPAGVQCYLPHWMESGRGWGVTCQLYGLRSRRNHGIGDFEDLARLGEEVAAAGGDFIGTNPLHALFSADPERCSPFSPSNRRFLNPLYIALDAIPHVGGALPVRAEALRRARAGVQIDYGAVARLKLDVLRGLWREHGGRPAGGPKAQTTFKDFIEAGGDALNRHAIFEAISRQMVASGRAAGWHDWPEEYRDARGRAVARFAAEHEDDVRFQLWLQWIADLQLNQAQDRVLAAGMRIGLYLDFAAGTAPDGSATWSNPELMVSGATMGAPPDAFFTQGQNWGLAPMSPAVLREHGGAQFAALLDSVSRHAGALRVDHALGLHRLFWIPDGMHATEGCYVVYPMAEMLRAIAATSSARKVILVGEDLGTVPDGFPRVMQSARMLSTRVLYFEKSRSRYRATASYPKHAFASVSNHDLPPLAAWWRGADVALSEKLGLVDQAEARQAMRGRKKDRALLVDRLCRDLPRRLVPAAFHEMNQCAAATFDTEIAAAVHAFVARTPSVLFGVQYEDLCGTDTPVNVPGTWDQYPNWRLRAAATVEDAPRTPLWRAVLEAVTRERPR